jgi:hypothetical protein
MFKKIDKKTLRESMTDTAIAMPIAWMASYGTLALMIHIGTVNALLISAIQTLILTIISIVRKYIVRKAFKDAESIQPLKILIN